MDCRLATLDLVGEILNKALRFRRTQRTVVDWKWQRHMVTHLRLFCRLRVVTLLANGRRVKAVAPSTTSPSLQMRCQWRVMRNDSLILLSKTHRIAINDAVDDDPLRSVDSTTYLPLFVVPVASAQGRISSRQMARALPCLQCIPPVHSVVSRVNAISDVRDRRNFSVFVNHSSSSSSPSSPSPRALCVSWG